MITPVVVSSVSVSLAAATPAAVLSVAFLHVAVTPVAISPSAKVGWLAAVSANTTRHTYTKYMYTQNILSGWGKGSKHFRGCALR